VTDPTYTRADLEMVAFLASRLPWKVQKERYRPGPVEQAIAEYDLATEQNLRFIRGQAENIEQKRAA
jgi:hypothetical protein